MAREQRKLGAILAADVVGYSRLMGGTRAARWRACVSIVKTPGGRAHALWRTAGQAH